MTDRTLQVSQHLLMAAAIVLLAASALTFADSSVSSRRALRAFDQAQATGAARDAPNSRPLGRDEDVDFSLWSEQRVRAYKEGLPLDKMLPWAVLGISKLRIRVPVFDGTDDLVLNRGVGWIVGTGRPGEAGNIGLAGHRDGFFRGLKDIAVGDAVELTTLAARATYVVDEIEIVHSGTRRRARAQGLALHHTRHLLPVLFHRRCAAALHRARHAWIEPFRSSHPTGPTSVRGSSSPGAGAEGARHASQSV